MFKKLLPLITILLVVTFALPTEFTAPLVSPNSNLLNKTRENTPTAKPLQINMPAIPGSKAVIISQNFDGTWSTTTPPTGWTIRYGATVEASDWGRNNYTWGVGAGNASIYWSPSVTEDDSLISPTINLTGYGNVVLNCTTYYDHYSGAYTAQIRGSTDGGATYPYLIYDFQQTTQIVGLHVPLAWAANQANVKILFLGSGNTFNMNWWCVDEFSITADSLVAADIGVSRIIQPSGLVTPGAITPQAVIKNYGTATSPAASVRFDITPGYTNTQSVPSLGVGDSITISFASWTGVAGNIYTTKCTTMLTGDGNHSNDFKTGSVSVVTFVQDFEPNDAGYTAPPPPSGPENRWEWGTPTNVGPATAHSGTKLWGTVLNGNYGQDNANWWLVSCMFLASANNPTLYYYDWWSTEASWDGYNISYSTDNGQTWTLITPVGGYNYSTVYGLGEPGFSGNQSSWQLKTATIPVNAGVVFKLRWRFGSDASVNNYPGVYIDDVAGIGFAPLYITNDVGVAQITYPGATVQIGANVQPKGRIKNYGLAAQTNVPVTCWIDSLGVRIYNQTVTISYIGAGETASAIFPNWLVGSGPNYDMTMFTNLPTDSWRLNDTAYKAITAIPWGDLPPPATTPDRLSHATVYNPVNDKIYMIGGTPDGTTGSNVNLCQEYDPVANAWTDKATMPTAKGWIDGEVVRGNIYVIGGYNNSAVAINENVRYDPVGNAWTTRAPRPRIAACEMDAVWRDSLIYAIGGTNLSIGYTFVDIYNPFSNTWSTGTAMPVALDMGDAVIIGDTIYIPGAVLNRSTYLSYLLKGAINPANPNQISWITGPTMAYPTCIMGATDFNGRVYWLGGFITVSSVTDMFFEYDPATNTITNLENYPVTLARCCYLVTRPSERAIYVIAGDANGDWSPPNRTYYKYVFPPIHDVGCTKLELPSGAVIPGDPVTPACSVYNYGNATETYNVRLKIGTVVDTFVQVTGHAAGTAQYVVFPTWTAVAGSYTVTCSTELATDIDNTNDKQTGSLTVGAIDAELVQILQPANFAIIDTLPFVPRVRVRNNSTFTVNFPLEFVIYKGGSLFYSGAETAYALTGGGSADITFDTCYVVGADSGAYSDSARVLMSGDPNPANNVKTGTFQIKPGGQPPPQGWQAMTDVPSVNSGKNPKSGSCMAGNEGTGKIYFLKASNTQDFHIYTIDPSPNGVGSWVTESMPLGEKPNDGKKPKKGASMASYGDGIYVLRGNNTPGFWKYKVAPAESTGWTALAPITTGAKNPKDASGMVAFTKNDTGYLFVMKGSKTSEFYLYNINTNTWSSALPAPPIGPSGKEGYKKGSCLAYDGSRWVYVLKGQYGDFFKYDLVGDSGWVPLTRYDYKAMLNREGKKKKIGEGSGLVYHNDNIYLLKGGNTLEFWKYGPLSGTAAWSQMDSLWDIPTGPTGKKRVKGGGGLISFSGFFWASKGNNTPEFYRHVLPADLPVATLTSTNEGAMGSKATTNEFKLTIAPNPAINLTAIRYTLPVAGPVSFKLYNVTGALVKTYANTTPTKEGVLMLDTKTLPSGVYILRFASGDIRVTRKIVLEK